MTDKEKEFYSKPFKFSYSSLNKLLYSPSLFYKDYILNEREEKTEAYLIEGKVVHCLLFEPENLNKKFNVSPSKTPTDSVRKVITKMVALCAESQLEITDITNDSEEFKKIILDALISENLYQSLKEDSARLAKIQTEENKAYWEFINNSKLDVIDNDTLVKCQEKVDIIKANESVMSLFTKKQSDFDLDPIQTYAEQPLECKLKDLKFGLKGIIDFYQVDDDTKEVTICDLKTTGKTVTEFTETIDFYNYWLQAAIYCKLVYENLPEDKKEYQIIFKFVVIDKYNQVYVFDVSELTLSNWAESFEQVIERANFHYTNNNYSLPFEFLTGKVIL